MDHYYLGIDIGTSESKGVLINSAGKVMAFAAKPHALSNPRPGYFEHDAEADWWDGFCQISKKLLMDTGISPEDIKAIGTSALGPDLVPVDRDCRPLSKAILYGIDSRSTQEIQYLTSLWGEEKLSRLIGRPLNTNDICAKILWLKNHKPGIHEAAYKFLTASSFITARLTGKYLLDSYLAMGCFLPLYKPEGTIDEENCALFCRPDQLPELNDAMSFAGVITAKAAAETGLAAGTPVLTGTDDAGAEAVSVGVFTPDSLMVMFGSSLYLIGLCRGEVADDRIWGSPFLLPEFFSVQGGTNNAGTATKWFQENFYENISFQDMERDIQNIPPGSNGLIMLPYLAGERTPINDPSACGLLFGLTLKHTKAHMYRALLEGIGYSIEQHLQIFRENGCDFKYINAIGGGSGNATWMQIVADITGIPVRTCAVTYGASYGDAIMAAVACKEVSSFTEASDFIIYDKIYTPCDENRKIYTSRQPFFAELYEKNKEIMHSHLSQYKL